MMLNAEQTQKKTVSQRILLMFVNGVYSAAQSDVGLLPNDMITHSSDTHEMVLSIPKNYKVPAPIYISYLNTEADVQQSTRQVILAAENSEVTLVEEYLSDHRGSYAHRVEMNMVAESNARIYYYKIQNESLLATHAAELHIEQKQDSCIKAFFFAKGSQVAQDHIDVKLMERGAECRLHGLYTLTQDKQNITYQVLADHSACHTTSVMLFKGTMDKKSRAAFHGKVFVHENAQQINAHQENHNLLLSPLAEVDVKPELEIYADDIKCTHGATVGQLDQDALFYLRSRGIEKQEALTMLVQAFADDIFSHIDQPSMKQELQDRVHSL